MKPRKDLDKIVLDHAEQAGAKVLFHTQANEPVFERGVLTGLHREARRRRRGDPGQVRRRAPRERPRSSAARSAASGTSITRWGSRSASTSVPRCRAPVGSRPTSTSVPDRHALPGYGWVFPVGDGTVNVGVGLLSTYGGWRDVNLHDLQTNFITNLPPEWEINARHGLLQAARRAPVHGRQRVAAARTRLPLDRRCRRDDQSRATARGSRTATRPAASPAATSTKRCAPVRRRRSMGTPRSWRRATGPTTGSGGGSSS